MFFAQEEEPSRPNRCSLGAEAEKEKFEMPSTSQNNPTIEIVGERSTAIFFIAADSVQTNESDPCLTAEVIQNESAYIKSVIDDSSVYINPIENTNDQQPKSAENGNSENIGPTKRQRKPKCGSSDKTEQIQSAENKPTRGRRTKSKPNPIKVEQPSLALLLNDDVIGKNGTHKIF